MMSTVVQFKTSNFETPLVQLPMLISINDLRNVVCALKKKPKGVSIVEITDIFRRRLFDPCKLMAYEAWGIVNYQQNVISLSDLGWKLADFVKSEAEVYRIVIKNFQPYITTLRWIAELEKNLVVSSEVIRFWNQNNFTNLNIRDEKVVENSVTSFFHLCHAAELGVASVGRKGQPTRLELDSDEIRQFFREPSEFPVNQGSLITSKMPNPANSALAATPTRILVSCGSKSDFTPSIREILEITNVSYQLQIREDRDDFLSGKTKETLQNCTAALIIAGEKSQTKCNGINRLDDRLLCEIVASYAIFETRISLLWKGSSPPMIPFKGLSVTCLKDELDWQTGIELGRRIKEFNYQAA